MSINISDIQNIKIPKFLLFHEHYACGKQKRTI